MRNYPNQLSIFGLTVSIVSHGQRDITASLLKQLALLSDVNVGRVVVTHNLQDIKIDKPDHAGYDLVQLQNSEPRGFSENHNLAFEYCETPYFAVLNPDIELLFGNPFPALLDAMNNDARLGAVAPALVQPGTLNVEPNRRFVTPIELIRRRLPGYLPPVEPDWLVGAFLITRSEVYRDLGGFDRKFKLYCEDVDLGARIVRAGFAIRRLESVKVFHLTHRGSHRNLKYAWLHFNSLFRLWNKYLFARRNIGWKYKDRTIP